ncbi:MAG: condensation domain-containing protein, partial [Cyanobacteria bacterium J06649_11]
MNDSTFTKDDLKNEYKRKMSGTERKFLRMPSANVVMVAQINGLVSREQLKAAVIKARQKHFLLGIRVSLDKDSAGWFTQKEVPEIPVEVIPRFTNEDWIQTTIEELKRTFSTQTGPLIRFLLLKSPEVSDLIVTAHHSICDGRSLVYLIRDIMVYLSNPEQDVETPQVIPVVVEDCLPSSVMGSFLYRLIVKRINRKWMRKGIFFNDNDYKDLHQTFWQNNKVSILSWELTEPQTSTLVSRCRQEQVTINSALYAAFIAAQNHIQGNSQPYLQNIMVPVDFRSWLRKPVGEAIGFYASAVMFKQKYHPKKSFWDMARIIDKKIKQHLTNKNIFQGQKLNLLSPSLMDGLVFAKQGKLNDKMALNLLKKKGLDKLFVGIVISNLGKIDIPVDYGNLHLEAVRGAAVYSDSAEKILEVVTVGGKMYLTLTFGDTII